ncbi:MAG: SGNH/GDSL hydrolase family protein [Cyanobacteriota bacterium]
MNVLLISFVVLLGILVLLEVGLRFLVGLGNPPLYVADPEIGYLLAPNQRTRRFGNRIAINEYSMRSPTITRSRDPSTLRVLLLGDSVANGASWTDQEQTISAMITTQLELIIGKASSQVEDAMPQEKKPTSLSSLSLSVPEEDRKFPGKLVERIEVLNASANSWGPQNELAYLKRFGTFEAQAVVLLLNTDDLFAPAPTSEAVGRDRNYPNHKPPFALAELFNRYLWPKLPLSLRKAINTVSSFFDRHWRELTGKTDPFLDSMPSLPQSPLHPEGVGKAKATHDEFWEPESSQKETALTALVPQETALSHNELLNLNLNAICQIQTLAEEAGAKFLLAMTPRLREISEPGSLDYELKCRDRLSQLAQTQSIYYLDFLPLFKACETPQRFYRDSIHLSSQGNQAVSEVIARSLQQLLQLPTSSTKG